MHRVLITRLSLEWPNGLAVLALALCIIWAQSVAVAHDVAHSFQHQSEICDSV